MMAIFPAPSVLHCLWLRYEIMINLSRQPKTPSANDAQMFTRNKWVYRSTRTWWVRLPWLMATSRMAGWSAGMSSPPLIKMPQADEVFSGHLWSFHCKLGLPRLRSKLGKLARLVISASGWHVSSLLRLGEEDSFIRHSDGHCCGRCSWLFLDSNLVVDVW